MQFMTQTKYEKKGGDVGEGRGQCVGIWEEARQNRRDQTNNTKASSRQISDYP